MAFVISVSICSMAFLGSVGGCNEVDQSMRGPFEKRGWDACGFVLMRGSFIAMHGYGRFALFMYDMTDLSRLRTHYIYGSYLDLAL